MCPEHWKAPGSFNNHRSVESMMTSFDQVLRINVKFNVLTSVVDVKSYYMTVYYCRSSVGM